MLAILIKDLRLSPMRTFLTGFSMFVGIVALIIGVLMGTLGKESLLAVNAQSNGFDPVYSVSLMNMNFIDTAKVEQLLMQLESGPGKKTITVNSEMQMKFAPLGQLNELTTKTESLYKNLAHVDTIFTTADYNQVYNLPMYSGRWFNTSSENMQMAVVVNKAGQNFFNSKHIVASAENSLSLVPFNVVGVVNDGKDSPTIYFDVKPLLNRTDYIKNIKTAQLYWHINENLSIEQIKSNVTDTLYDTVGGEVQNIQRINANDGYELVIGTLQLGLFVSASLLLFVSILGQINIGLAALEQRTHELLIRRALGASKMNIGMQVLGSLVLLSAIVCIIAILVSMGVIQGIFWLLPHDSPITHLEYPVAVAFVAVVVSVMTALIGGLVPAIKATKLEPALALR